MTPEHRHALHARWLSIQQELADLLDGKVITDVDPATREGELLEQQDEIEFELGSDQLDCGMSE